MLFGEYEKSDEFVQSTSHTKNVLVTSSFLRKYLSGKCNIKTTTEGHRSKRR